MSYAKQVVDNYNNLILKDKLELVERLTKLNRRIYEDGGWDQELSTIKEYLFKQLQGSIFPTFYSNLTANQKKEFQTQLYLEIAHLKEYDIKYAPEECRVLAKVYDQDTEEKEKETYQVDFPTFCIELKNTSNNESSHLIYDFIDSNYRIGLKGIDETPEAIKELIHTIKKCISVIRDNINEKTRNAFDSLSLEQQIYILFKMLDYDKRQLDNKIEEREYFKKIKAQNQYKPVNEKGYIKRRFPKIKQNHSNPNKVCY